MRLFAALLPLPLVLGLGACAPMSIERAEQVCFERARLALRPRGEAYFGATTEGPAYGLEVEITSDYLQGRDPAEVYDACVFEKSGQFPRRPLYAREDWKG
ncbi:hypothetical protein [Ostreiculturibacter nitratireducens]|uniref:hypothetical protein n=1 Tax=Ostreiculturibacter nitratireducens TaxID=3075226 RepID=UPI0031B5DCA7